MMNNRMLGLFLQDTCELSNAMASGAFYGFRMAQLASNESIDADTYEILLDFEKILDMEIINGTMCPDITEDII
jgi:hypothetical protein